MRHDRHPGIGQEREACGFMAKDACRLDFGLGLGLGFGFPRLRDR
jgi:hypothetical protein